MQSDNKESDSLISSLQSVSGGAGLFLAGSVISKSLGFLFTILLTRTLGTTLYGIYAFANTIWVILSDFGTFGSERALLRFLPVEVKQEEFESVVLAIAYITTLVGSISLSLGVYIFAPVITATTLKNTLLTDIIRIFAIVLPFYSISFVTISVFRSLEDLKYQVLVRDVTTPVIKLVFVGSAILVGYSLFGVAAAIAASILVIFFFSFYLLLSRTRVRPTLEGVKGEVKSYYNFCLPVTVKDIGGLVVTRIDVLMIGFFLSGEAVGIYNIAILVSGLLVLPVRAANQLTPPIISRIHAEGDYLELQSIYSVVARWVLTVTLLPGVGILVYRRDILAVFGSSFTAGSMALLLLCLGYLIKAAGGPSGHVLMMTDHQYLNMINQWIMAIMNLLLNYYLIQKYGIIGAAIATSFTMTFINLLRVIEVQYTKQLFPYNSSFVKPMASAAVTSVVLLGITSVLTGYVSMIVGGFFGSFTYIISLYALGLEDIDRQFAATIFEGFTST